MNGAYAQPLTAPPAFAEMCIRDSIKFCTKLSGKDSWFLPFDKGYNDGAGNPPNPDGLMTDYLWKDILTKEKLTLIIENYCLLYTSRCV